MAMEESQPHQEQGPPPRTREAVDWWLTKWGRTEVVDGKEPLTRQDVEWLIEVNGGTAEGLYLQSRNFQGCDLREISLGGALLGWANFEKADLTRADFRSTGKSTQLMNVQFKEACLRGAKLDGAVLWLSDLRGVDAGGASAIGADLAGALLHSTCFQGADLTSVGFGNASLENTNLRFTQLGSANFEGFTLDVPANSIPRNRTHPAQTGRYTKIGDSTHMEGAYLYGATITDGTRLRRVQWGKDFKCGEELDGRWREAAEPYRTFKQWHQDDGDYDIAAFFHYREWECKRKLAQQERKWLKMTQFWIYRMLAGYGERPGNVVFAGAAIILLFALGYFPYSWPLCFGPACWVALWEALWKSLYFSGASFTALGYGQWVVAGEIAPVGWTRYFGVVESLFGISLIALFLVTFTRKMTR